MTISKGISTMSKTMSIQTMIAITMIQSIRISFTLCNMDSTSRIGNISTSTGIGTVDSRYSSRSNTMDTNSVGNVGYTITNCMVDRNSMSNMVDRSSNSNMVGRSSMSNMVYRISMSNMVYRSSMSNMVDRSGMSNMVDRSGMSNMVDRSSMSNMVNRSSIS